jgi:hypothetical protein
MQVEKSKTEPSVPADLMDRAALADDDPGDETNG